MKGLFLALIAAFTLAACATTGASLSDSERLGIYREHAGAPIPSFHYFGRLHGWGALGDSALVIWQRPNRGYLLSLAGSCPQLDYARAITFSDRSGSVFAGFDNVMVLDRRIATVPCRIKLIQPLDGRAVKAAERKARDAAQASAGGP